MGEEDICDGLRKRFARSFLDLTILKMLVKEPLWGYRMMTVLEERNGVKVGPPVIYPLLDSMETDRLIEGKDVYRGKRKRKMYSITGRGSEYLKCLDKILSDMVD